MAERAPLHLVTRSTVIESHVRHLARDRGLEQDFGEALVTAGERAEEARQARDKAMLEAAIEDLRALARRLAAAPASSQTLGGGRGGLRGEHGTTLGPHDGGEAS